MIIDLHCDTLLLLKNNKFYLSNSTGHINLDKLVQSNYMCQCFAVWTHLKKMPNHKDHVDKMIDAFYENMEKHSNRIKPVKSYQEIINNYKNGYISAMLTIEDLGVIHSIEELVELYNRGVRMATITWNFENDFGYPAWEYIDENTPPLCNPNKGLTELGISLIKKMEELGMIIDVSHLNDQGIYDILKYTTKPFVASHSNSRTICNVPRNLPDELLLLMKDRGCVIGMNYCPDFVKENSCDKLLISDLIKHIDYIKNLIGIDYISLGSDFDGIGGDLEIKDASYMNLLIDELEKHGYTKEEIDKITHLNALRLFKEIL